MEVIRDVAAVINELLPTDQHRHVNDPLPLLLSILNTMLAPHDMQIHVDQLCGGAGGGLAGAVWHVYQSQRKDGGYSIA